MAQPDVTRPRLVRHFLPPRPVGLRVELRLAAAWGCTPATAHQRMQYLAGQVADVVTAMLAAEQPARARRYIDPILLALEPDTIPPYSLELVAWSEEADGLEQLAKARAVAEGTPVMLAALERALADQEHRSRILRLAVARRRQELAEVARG